MSIYKQSVLPEFTWLCRIIIAIVATEELCLEIPLSLKQWLIRCLGDDNKSVQTSAWDFASFILYSCLHWLSGNITDSDDVLVIWLKYAIFFLSFLWMNVKTSYYLWLSSPVFCSSGEPSISPSAAAGQRNPGSLPGCSEVWVRHWILAAWWGPATPCCPGRRQTDQCWGRREGRSHRRTGRTCPWVSKAGAPSAGPVARPSGPVYVGLNQVVCWPACLPGRPLAGCLGPAMRGSEGCGL